MPFCAKNPVSYYFLSDIFVCSDWFAVHSFE